MASSSLRPRLVAADAQGNIYDHPRLLMACRRGAEISLPRPDELIPLPEESELFLLPGRRALGFDPDRGVLEEQEELAVAAFAAPAHTLTAHPAYARAGDAPVLPLFAYGAVGFAHNRFYLCAKRVDADPRQEFHSIPPALVRKEGLALAGRFPGNRLLQHLVHRCALTYACPAARNLCLGRYEAPLPVSRTCNARCLGCISSRENDSPIRRTPQNRLDFTPTAEEIVEVMRLHASRGTAAPIYSFGQGCEGEPLNEAPLITGAIRQFRSGGGGGTINVNSNASRPETIAGLAEAGLSSLRVSLNSARPEAYVRYHRPVNYTFDRVVQSIRTAKEAGLYVSLNLLFFPGFSDAEEEIAALIALIQREKVDCLQLRNLNIDPDLYLDLLRDIPAGPCAGFLNARKRLLRECPGLRLGYFNPPVAPGG
jgi:pyruvate-formate lyase-activating enzyme